MLHSEIGIKNKNGRRVIHSTLFKEKEELFKDYDKAIKYITSTMFNNL
ncbi:hypothetical protein MCHI_002300 [Candidatus Magnetoovum chiemensis]|nr:hypothetical protein MCHI_002300 [Candidatus Magnetoovum chiemensis]